MSDKLMLILPIVSIVCVTIVVLAAMFFFATYSKEKLQLKNKASIKDLADIETAITAEDKNKNSKK